MVAALTHVWDYALGDSGAPLRNFLCTAFGAVLMLLFGLIKGLPSTKERVKTLYPGRSETFYERTDFVILWIAGTLLAWFLYNPTNPRQSIIAGLTWVGTLKAVSGVSEKALHTRGRRI